MRHARAPRRCLTLQVSSTANDAVDPLNVLRGMIPFELLSKRGARTRRLVLRRLAQRSEQEVRTVLGEGAALVERRLRRHVRGIHGHLPMGWLDHVVREQMVGNGRSVPDMVNYTYQDRPVLTVWTGVIDDDLHIVAQIMPPPKAADRTRRLMFWEEMPWSAHMAGA